MFAENIEKRAIGKALFVITQSLHRIHARENCCLSGRALRATRHAETRIGRNDHTMEDCCRLLVRKNCERFGIRQVQEWIGFVTLANAETVDEEEEYCSCVTG